MPSAAGTSVDENGFVNTVSVASTYTAVSSDIVIAERLHSSAGERYIVETGGTPVTYAAGTAQAVSGAELVTVVAASYSRSSGDSAINGALHDSTGRRYVCDDATPSSTLSIEGISYTSAGVMCVAGGVTPPGGAFSSGFSSGFD